MTTTRKTGTTAGTPHAFPVDGDGSITVHVSPVSRDLSLMLCGYNPTFWSFHQAMTPAAARSLAAALLAAADLVLGEGGAA